MNGVDLRYDALHMSSNLVQLIKKLGMKMVDIIWPIP